MAWIKSHQHLADSPKTFKLARLLDVPVPYAIGTLQLLWWSSLDHSERGDFSKHDAVDLASLSRWQGDPQKLVDALVASRFLDRTEDGGLVVHEWEKHMGPLHDQRERSKARANEARCRKEGHRFPVTRNERATNAHATRNVCVRCGARGEESREEESIPVVPSNSAPAPLTLVAPEPPSARKRASADEGFEKFWDVYPVKAGKANALRAWKGLTEAEKLLATEKAAVYARLTAGATAIKYAQGWLNGRRWEDDPETWKRLGRPLDGARPASPPPLPYDPIANEARKRRMLGLDP